MSQFDWDIHFIKMAELNASKSKDRSTKVGALIVGPDNEIRSAGFNGFPMGTNDDVGCRHERPAKYLWTEHAERSSIYLAARTGTPLKGCRMYLNWFPYPCADCARGVIQSGIIEVIGPNRPFVSANNPKGRADWEASFVVTREMFQESGVTWRVVEIPENLQRQMGWIQ